MTGRARWCGAAAALSAALAFGRAIASGQSVAETPHNLSVSGPGRIRAATETQICVFCHTPHDGDPAAPLWNHQQSAGVVYVKSSMPRSDGGSPSAAPDPNGSSKLCLSCHDGTVALGALRKGSSVTMASGETTLAPGRAGHIGTDLSKTHPVSFVVTNEIVTASHASEPPLTSIAAMKSDPNVHLDRENRVQCTACHDPHSDANFATSGVRFYNKPLVADACTVCHAGASRSTPAPLLPDPTALNLPQGPATLVVNASGAGVTDAARARTTPSAVAHVSGSTLPQGCMSCHAGHAPEEGKRALLRSRPEDACYRCHGARRGEEVRAGRLASNVQTGDLQTEFLKPSHHPVEWPGDHKPNERTPEANPNARRHVLCVDCHDAHSTLGRQATSPTATAPKRASTRRFATEAEMCLLCHGNAANRPARQPNVARQFTATSFHPVLGEGRGTFVPSLVAPLTTASVVACTDCHGNSDPAGPAGPHGSVYAPLLVRLYARDDLQAESSGRYDLCYRCHDRKSILGDVSFPSHSKHVRDLRAPCSACHDAHGADAPHLVQFDPAIVQPNSAGMRSFVQSGAGGQCYLSCHGSDHAPKSYCAPGKLCTAPVRSQAAARRSAPAIVSPIPSPGSLFPGWPGK